MHWHHWCLTVPLNWAGWSARINLVGNSGCGELTLAARLSKTLALPLVELDALYRMQDWTPRSLPDCSAQMRSVLGGPGWILDGNDSSTTDINWANVDVALCLD